MDGVVSRVGEFYEAAGACSAGVRSSVAERER
jgi:hypothetical protein